MVLPMHGRPRIALIHATAVAVEPIQSALAAAWPAAEPVNLLDDALSVDRAKDEALMPAMTARILTLAGYAREIGSDGILFTCSAFGPAIEAAALESPMPVLKPNEAMFEAALELGTTIGLIATFARSVASMRAEFDAEAARLGRQAELRAVVVPEAMQALRQGDAETHNRLVAESMAELADCDAVMLAQFSTSRAADAARQISDVPILSSPDSAVLKMKRLMGED